MICCIPQLPLVGMSPLGDPTVLGVLGLGDLGLIHSVPKPVGCREQELPEPSCNAVFDVLDCFPALKLVSLS